MKEVYFISLKYAPGLYKEFKLLGNKFKQKGNKINYFLSKGYNNFCEDEKEFKIVSNGIGNKGMILDTLFFPYVLYKIFKNINKNENEKMFIFYNPHPINFLIQLFLKLISKTQSVIILHEPYKTLKDRLEYGFKGLIFFSIVNFLQFLSIVLSDKIVTMSPYGSKLFLKYFPKYKKKLIIANLLILNKWLVKEKEREFFSYIGRVNKGKGIEDFIRTINFILNNNIYNYYFLIITSSNIEEYVKKLSPGYEKILKIINKKDISDKEIDEVIVSSKAVLILHQTASQSGVLPLCCKYKTPIIARNIKAFSQYIHGNGILLSKKFQPLELIEACKEIEKNFDEYSENSKKIFYKYFSEKNFNKFYNDLL